MAAATVISDDSARVELQVLSASEQLRQERSARVGSGLRTGIKSIDTQLKDLFNSARFIGLGQKTDDDAFDLSTHLTVSSLLRSSDSNANARHPIFFLAPPSSSIITSVHTLLCQKLMLRPPIPGQSTESIAMTLLENIQLLRYLDLPGLTESLFEVSQRLFERYQGILDKDNAANAGSVDSPGSIILVQGLSQVLSSVQRRSGLVQTCALLSNLLRTIRHLNRAYCETVVLVELEIATDAPYSDAGNQETRHLESAFSTATGVEMRLVPENIVGGLLEREMDVLVCVHDGFGKTTPVSKGKGKEGEPKTQTRIVEVVKDRVGGRFGEWCVWVQ